MSDNPKSIETPRAGKELKNSGGAIQGKAKPKSKERPKPKVAAGPPVQKTATPKPEGEAAPKSGAAKSGRRRVIFRVAAEPGSEVFVAGNFNGWEPTKYQMMDKTGKGNFERQIYASPGPLEYKFVINGEWVIDARCPAWVPNSMGSLNSVIDVH